MGLVRILDPRVADRIAAGEVVERPASVVRELLDNAMDAKATRVEVVLERGGAGRIAVSDDGTGMDADDALLAFERHATSKIRSADDLVSIATLGFRGEALAAIAAVSRVVALTRARGHDIGTRVVIDRGTVLKVEPAARAPGTTIEVRDLFIGVPARLKFMKAESTELDHCLRVVRRAALCRADIGLRVLHHERVLLDLPPVADGWARVDAIYGERGGRALVRVSATAGPLRVEGWASRADLNRGGRDDLHIFVNGRAVRDPLLVRAVLDAYRNTLPAGRYPIAVLRVDLPPDLVDVNVHPAKSEVRFQRPQEIRALLVGAVADALGSRGAMPALPTGATRIPSGVPASWGAPWERDQPTPGRIVDAPPDARPDAGNPVAMVRPVQSALIAGAPRRALAQYRNCYILAEDERGLLIVDQHVAHERMLYESLLLQAEGGPLPRQAALFAQVLEVGPEGCEAAMTLREVLLRAGFVVEPFGAHQLRVAEVPAVFGRNASPDALRVILDELIRGGGRPMESLWQHALATVACHTAVRKGQELTREKMDYILRGLDACEAPHHCPHGRVVSMRVDLGDLDRSFGRS